MRGSSWYVLGAGRAEGGRGRERGTQPVLGPWTWDAKPHGGAAEAGRRVTGSQAGCGDPEGSGAPHAPRGPGPRRGNRPRCRPSRPLRRGSRCHLTARPAASSSAGCQSSVSMVTASGRSLRPLAPPAPSLWSPRRAARLSEHLRTPVPASPAWSRRTLALGEHASPGRPCHPISIQLLKKCLLSARVPGVSMAPNEPTSGGRAGTALPAGLRVEEGRQ